MAILPTVTEVCSYDSQVLICNGDHATINYTAILVSKLVATLANLGPVIPSHLLKPCTPVNPDRLVVILGDNPKAPFLVEGFCEGFIISHISITLTSMSHNHKSAVACQLVLPEFFFLGNGK